jgi:hypothetical protein
MLGVTGRLLMLSTPAGRRGAFFEFWESGGQDWERVKVPATDSPLWTPEALEEQLALLGDYAFRQEFGLEFVDDATSLFSEELLAAAFTSEVAPLWEGTA